MLFTRHAEDKLARHLVPLGVSRSDVENAVRNPDEVLYDTLRDRFVAVKYGKRIAVVYEKKGDTAVVITVIYSSKLKRIVERRRRSGRWI